MRLKAPPHNSAARQAMSFPPSAACKFLALPPVNLRNLHLHLTKNPFAGRPPHLCSVALKLLWNRNQPSRYTAVSFWRMESLRLCVMRMTHSSGAASRRVSMSSAVASSSAEVPSSRRTYCTLRIRARAKAMRWRYPPDRFFPFSRITLSRSSGRERTYSSRRHLRSTDSISSSVYGLPSVILNRTVS